MDITLPEYLGALVVECLKLGRGRGFAGSSLTALCPRARLFILYSVLVQPRKARPNMTAKMLTGT